MCKKVLVVTLQNSSNYGAFLQAFAMKSVLEEKEFDVVFTKAKESIILTLQKSLKKNLKRTIFIFKTNQEYKKSQRVFKTEEKISNIRYDYCIIGSDELWNVRNCSFIHSDIYIGAGINAEKKIVYGVSCNDTNYQDFIQVYKNCEELSNMEFISVRDDNTKKLCEKLNLASQKVLDPTFLLNREAYPAETVTDKNYVLVYGYGFFEKEITAIKAYAESKGLPVISVGFYQKWADKNVVAGPFDFLGYIKQADFIFTSTFHGTIFSIIYNKQFRTFARSNYKVISLLEDLGLEAANLSEVSDTKKVDYVQVNKQIEILKEESLEFLNLAMS